MQHDMPEPYLFVYGTLCRHVAHSQYYRIADYCDFVGDGVMQGQLFRVKDYPGAVLSTQRADKVYGEVFRLLDTAKALSVLDHYEECSEHFPRPHEYICRQLPIILQNGHCARAWVYLYNFRTVHLELIRTGSFVGNR